MDLNSMVKMLMTLINAPLKMLHSIDRLGLFDWSGISFD